MEHLDFIVWMIGAPFFETISTIIRYKWGERKEYTDDVRGWAAVFTLAVYFFVGYQLF